MSSSYSFKRKLFKHTSFLGLPLWVLIILLTGLFIVLILVIISLCFICRRRRRRKSNKDNCFCLPNPIPCKPHRYDSYGMSSLDRRLLPRNIYDIEMNNGRFSESHTGTSTQQHFIVTDDVESVLRYLPVAKDVWRGCKFSLKEIEMATNRLAKENVIGSGDYGVVYRGILLDNTRVALKKLVSGRYL